MKVEGASVSEFWSQIGSGKGEIYGEKKKRGKITVIKRIFKTKFPNWVTMMGWPKMYLESEKVKMD